MLRFFFKNTFYILLNFCLFFYLISGLNTNQINNNTVSSRCRNPNGHWGYCVSIYECDNLLNILRFGLSENYRFLRHSQCQPMNNALEESFAFVCCTTDISFTVERNRIVFPDDKFYQSNNSKEIQTTYDERDVDRNYKSKQKFPMPPQCGALTIETKIYGGMEAKLTEFSWMVNLEYLTAKGQLVSVCAGSLINERYVLTAAHCIKGKIQKKVGEIVSIRLGDHNIDTDIDCDDTGCLEQYQRVGIEAVIVHENYSDRKDLGLHQHNDIALIRLDKKIQFTDSIQPVCLPLDGIAQNLENGMKLTVAGWGHNSTATYTSTKQKVTVPFVDLDACRESYKKKIYIADEQLCAGGVYRQDSCNGDSGGPLMHLCLKRYAWILDGIVSFGRGCGLETPSVYTRVSSYLNWIDQNIKP